MKCPKCGRPWDVSNKITSSTYVCPYCGENVDSYGQSKKNLGEIICGIKQDFGDKIIEDTARLNALLMDYAPDMIKERKLIINALKEGVLVQLRRGIEEEKEALEIVARRCSTLLVSEMWITESAAQYAVSVIIQAMGYEAPTISKPAEEKHEEHNHKSQLIKGESAFGSVIQESNLKAYSSIGYKAFASNKQLTEVFVPKNIKRIYPKAFLDCTELKKVSLTHGTELIGRGVFDGCIHLGIINIGDNPRYTATNGQFIDKSNKVLIRHFGMSDKVLSIVKGVRCVQRKAFERSQIEQIDVPSTVEIIEEDAFYMTMKLQKIEVDGTNTKYRSYDGVLHSRDGRELIRYPQGKLDIAYYLEDNVIKIRKKAFSCATTLSSITFAGSLQEICENAFEYCIGIENIMLPRSVEVIGERAFQYCEKMMSVMLPQGIIRIGDCAFLGCSLLRTVSVPRSVKEIGNMAFSGCQALSKVVIQDNVTFIGDKAFSGCPNIEVSVKGNDYVSTYCKIHGIKCTTV